MRTEEALCYLQYGPGEARPFGIRFAEQQALLKACFEARDKSVEDGDLHRFASFDIPA